MATYGLKELTVFEQNHVKTVQAANTIVGRRVMPSYKNARGVFLTGSPIVSSYIGDTDIIGVKYGADLSNTGEVLIKNFRFRDRRSTDMYGAGILLGRPNSLPDATKGVTYISNAWIDLMHPEPIADYAIANNEGICIEKGQGLINIRESVIINSEESGIDAKSSFNIDSSFICAGHRGIRAWNGVTVKMSNCIILVPRPECVHLWGEGTGARIEWHNCKFGYLGDKRAQLESQPSRTMSDGSPAVFYISQTDLFDRGPNSFWQPAEVQVPPGFLTEPPTVVEKQLTPSEKKALLVGSAALVLQGLLQQ